MTDLVLIGVGRVGFQTLKYLSSMGDYEVLAIDCVDKSQLLQSIGGSIVFKQACKPSEALEIIREAKPRVVATALPSKIAGDYVETLLSNGFNVVDVSYTSFDPYVLEKKCLENKVFYIVDAGFAPGFSNMVVGWVYSKLGELNRVAIYVGGNPVNPQPPLYYEITWSAEDLIEEYTRPARIVRDYRVVEVDPLAEIMEVEIPSKGRYEAFYSDGLRTMIRNIKAREMFEATIRYPGHLRVIKLLRDLGFFDKKPVKINGYEVSPAFFTAKLFEERYSQKSADEAILYIEITGGDKYYVLLSILEGRPGESSIAKYTALVFAKTIKVALEEDIGVGVKPLEKLHEYYEDYYMYLEKQGAVTDVVTNI